MQFSIIIPVYNLEKHIEKCIQSVYDQGLDNNKFELLIINDGSTDGSKVLLERLVECYPNIWVFHKQNGGVSSARNIGINKAKGEYVLFLDGDDEFMPDALLNLSDMLKTSRADMIVLESIVKEGDELKSIYPIRKKDLNKTWRGTELAQRFTRGSACGVAFKNAMLKEHSIKFNENIEIGEDSLFYAEFSMFAKSVELHSLAFYKVNRREGSASDSLSYQKVLRMNYILEVLKDMMNQRTLTKDQKAVLGSLAFRIISRAMLMFQYNKEWGSIKENAAQVKKTKILPISLKGIKKYRHNIILLNMSYKLYYAYQRFVYSI